MKKEQRIRHYRESLERAERDCAALVTGANERLTAAERQLTELIRYREEYQQSLGPRALQGMSGLALMDFHAFVSRLGDAIRQQADVVARFRREQQQAVSRLQEAAVRHRTVGAVVERWRAEERVVELRRDQAECDELSRRERFTVAKIA
jgi:flagellar FliJ protein